MIAKTWEDTPSTRLGLDTNPGNCAQDQCNSRNTQRGVADQRYFSVSVRVGPGFRFAFLTRRQVPPCRSSTRSSLAGYSPEKLSQPYSPVPYTFRLSSDRSLPILYVDESHCLPRLRAAMFPPHLRQAGWQRDERNFFVDPPKTAPRRERKLPASLAKDLSTGSIISLVSFDTTSLAVTTTVITCFFEGKSVSRGKASSFKLFAVSCLEPRR